LDDLPKLPKRRHPHDLHCDLMGGLHAIAASDPQPLLSNLTDRPQHAFALIWALGSSHDKATMQALQDHLKHNDIWVRWAAIQGLVRRPTKRLAPVLLQALRDRSESVRFVALQGLAKLKDPIAIAPLNKYLAKKRVSVGGRQIATELLGKLERMATERGKKSRMPPCL
jgi:HEAT repeat protein